MRYFEFETKGMRIVGEDENYTWETSNLLHQLIDSFYEANAALNLYIKQNDALFDGLVSLFPHPPTDEEWMKVIKERERLASEVRDELGIPPDDWHEIHYQVEIKSKRNKWLQGSVPRQIESAEHQIFAKAFVYSFDSIVETLKNLKERKGVSEVVPKKIEEIKEAFPDLKDIRDTSHHLGDRVVGLKVVRGKKVPINPEGQNIVLSNHGDGMFYTMKQDGTQGAISITYESLEKMGKIIQDILDSFQWEGHKEHLPR
ncbi:hypothetical protein [Enterobacter kobei]|uniref:hypothetical protein n=1 Tax=Enterobacter kobei TaxID=208224 RepID=UPI00064380BB|nr:hypothetical protein [Enterobacter kobei]KLR28036.1 hypothetical protein ABR24_20655 [Enterobacter kobei]